MILVERASNIAILDGMTHFGEDRCYGRGIEVCGATEATHLLVDVLISDFIPCGYDYVDGAFVLNAKGHAAIAERNKAAVPESVTMDQAMIQLANISYDGTQTCYAYIQSLIPTMPDDAQASLKYRKNVRRDDPLTQQMIALLGWTEAEADTYFVEASKL